MRCDRVATSRSMHPRWSIATGQALRCFGSCSVVAVEEISGLKPEIATLLEPFADAKRKDEEQVRQKESTLETVGKAVVELARDL